MTNSASLPIGKYRLNMALEDVTGLTEFTQAEYKIYCRQFQGERNYNTPAVDFLKRQWKVALGTVGGRVYKIALYFESVSRGTVTDVSTDVMEYCQQRLGKPTEQNDTLFIWDASDGNVVLQLGKAGNTYQINFFQTSRNVRTFTPAR